MATIKQTKPFNKRFTIELQGTNINLIYLIVHLSVSVHFLFLFSVKNLKSKSKISETHLKNLLGPMLKNLLRNLWKICIFT